MSRKTAFCCCLAALIVLIAAQVLAQLLASLFAQLGVPTWVCNILAGFLYALLAFGLLKIVMEKIFKLSLPDLGMPKLTLQGKWVAVAVLLPMGVKAIYLFLIPGKLVPSGMNREEILQTLSAGIFFMGMAAGFVEEMVFRGVILNATRRAWGTKMAVGFPSMLFGLVHILGQEFSLGNCLLVVLAGTMVGVMFSLIALESGSTWNGAVVHAVWNVVIIGGGLAIGERADEYSVMTYVLSTKGFAITGGEFGVESSVISLAGYLLVALIALVWIWQKKEPA